MNKAGLAKLESLRADYARIVGRSFEHFYCPILFRDELTMLSRGHVVNEAFKQSVRRWTIQHSDVDSFFGAMFENDFVVLQLRDKHTALEALADKDLARQLNPRILFKGKEIEHYRPKGPIPDAHSQALIGNDGRPSARLAIKLALAEALDATDEDWHVEIERDLRLPALVCLLKAAHLTMFEMVGYEYGLSAAGHFVGHEILGKFFLANRSLPRPEILLNAASHFAEFVNLVRPISVAPTFFRDTVADRYLYLCTGTPKAWAFLILIKTGEFSHAVLIPILEDDEGAARFATFLTQPSPRFEVRLARYAGDRWEVARKGHMSDWPAASFT